MSLKSNLKEVDKLKAEFEALKPLKKEDEDRLWKKFRLDWNYNSNHIEGNTLTYGETELLLIFGKTTGDHTIREYEEMQAHDVAIKQVQQAADDKERPLTEQFIRLLNETLLVKPFWKEAQTADGQDTRREIIPGEYKKFPNTVRLENGELFHYAAPQDVPILMGDLITSYNTAVAEGKHPIEIAAMLHYKFVRIHPFDDGNGRVARLLMNYVLLHHGYQPVIIKTEAKKEYLNALNKTDILNPEIENINNVEPFAEYIANQLLWSYKISIKAAKGESIIEKGDFEKRIDLLKQRVFVANDREEVIKYYLHNLLIIFEKIINNNILPKSSFTSVTQNYMCEYYVNEEKKGFGKSASIDILKKDIEEKIQSKMFNMDVFSVKFEYKLLGFKDLGFNNAFDFQISIELKFENNQPKAWAYIQHVGFGYDEYSTFDQIENDMTKNIESQFDLLLKNIERKTRN